MEINEDDHEHQTSRVQYDMLRLHDEDMQMVENLL
jgi:hypothetical protein